MGKKGKDEPTHATPEPEESPPPPEPEPQEMAPPPKPSRILQHFGWETCQMETSGNKYYYSAVRREARVQPPYFTILNLDESNFCTFTKEDIWKAFFARKQEYKQEDLGALTEELKDPDADVDWALIMEAFSVLTNPEARAEYEQRNLMPHAQLQLTGLRVACESRKREEARQAALAEKALAEKLAAEELAAVSGA
mmetsp:Transcript_99684/g.157784  ORF Transcript_99684/g.157784 Transcript_99684/m.157784 type:complete len:196 (+) Transcript_99684:112-699(+)|eukprot:CAMPEP_0169121192 /NCGR_PEP_ID=MMETSP1015-20121227/32534_1 /TAXON_ID=342587 /ORGANISM="Karlodinium micrum, Strain CCMP2283" /LENGTH=195 /DNA_ID=CAMNT_0009184273 /DNA_START=112 /DNA_END=702 /DNA_ORIENTATION=-